MRGLLMNILSIIKLLMISMMSVFLYCVYIKLFKKASQTEREEGLRSHKEKNGTITMGGIIFLVLPLFFIEYSFNTLMIIIATIGFGILGFIDDLLIVIFKKNDGLSPIVKIIAEIIIAGSVFLLYLLNGNPTIINLFGFRLDLKWLFGLLLLGILVSSGNAWNLVDGVDGLCSGCSLIFGVGLMVLAYKYEKYDILYLLACYQICLFVFWCFNLPKAFLFMGDVGALGLGAFYAIVSINLSDIFIFLIMAGLFIFETLSVIIQVIYYKKTKGKRIFKMAPFHHHLEACGLREIYVDIVFYIIQVILVFSGVVISF